MEKIKTYAPAIARYGVGIVFFIFGIWQLIHPSQWFGYIPGFILGVFSPGTIIFFNGIFDTIVGLALIRGIKVRIFAGLGTLHLLFTSITLGFNDVAIRDFGLAVVLFSVFLHGPDKLCWDKQKD